MSRPDHDRSHAHEQDHRQATQPAADHPPAPPVPPDPANGSELTPPRPDPARGATVTSLDSVGLSAVPVHQADGKSALRVTTTALTRASHEPSTLDLAANVLKTVSQETKPPAGVDPVRLEPVLGPNDEPMVRFLNLKGIPPALKLFDKNRRNRTVEVLLRREMLRHQLKYTEELLDEVYYTLAAETIAAHVFDPLDNELVWVIRIVAAEFASDGAWDTPLGHFHRRCLFAALQSDIPTTGWGGANWFSRQLVTLKRELDAVGVEIQELGKKEPGQLLRIRYRGPREGVADATDAIPPRLPTELLADLRGGGPGVVLVTGKPERTEAEVDRLTKLAFCTNPSSDAYCGVCPVCQWYHYAHVEGNRDPELSLAQLPMPTLHVKAAGADAVTLSGKLSQHVAAERFLAVVEDVDKAADGFQKALSAVVEKESRVLWILTAQQEAKVLGELARLVQHHVVC